jgi:dipeptidyl aminopeptidase/acylaminoacyl peptidase
MRLKEIASAGVRAVLIAGCGVLAAPCVAAGSARAASGTPFTIQDLVRVRRVSDPVVAPDGRHVVFALRETDMEANRGRTHLWIVDLAGPDHEPRRLTLAATDDSDPRWAPDSRTIYFLSTRSGSSQVWRLALDGGEATAVTSYPLDVGSLRVAPTGDRIAISMAVLPGCRTLQCTRDKLAADERARPSGELYDRLFVRHWDTWSNGTRSHLFTARLRGDGTAEEPIDVSGRLDADVPSKPFGSEDDYDFSPDGRSIVFSARIAGRTEPWSTNFDLFEVPADGSRAPTDLTADNPAWDSSPTFLASGDLAYLAQDRPGFESDRFHIVIRDARTGARRTLDAHWDRSVAELGRTLDGRTLLAGVDDVGQHALYAIDPSSGERRRIVAQGQVTGFSGTHGSVVVALASLGAPPDLYSVAVKGGALHRLTSMNASLLDQRAMSEFEQFSFPGWHGETVHGYVVKPYGFDPAKRYPIAFIIHGGPQSSMSNEWSYRWNPEVFAGAGYGVVFIDFHGSPGYGQAFTDSISGDWGGKPLEDLQKGLAAAIARYPWLDGNRACALGASYGGFMINWIAGRWADRFRCLVDHDGVFDQRGMYYSTDELWFPEWEFGGPYFEVPQNYEKFNPADYVKAWRTPMLVVQGGHDYRVPLAQGLGTFTALQRRGIESQFLYFPDENHWVLRPANSIQWYDTVIRWLDRHLKE